MSTAISASNRVDRAALSRVRSVSQIELEFRGNDSKALFVALRREMLVWLDKRAGRRLPKHGWDGESFDMLEVGAQPVSALALEEPFYWCFRISDADKEVPRRSWTTEAGILVHEKVVLFGCRLQCVALAESPEFSATIPGVVLQMASKHPAWLDGRGVSADAWRVHSEQDVDDLVSLLKNPSRSRSVIVISLGSKDGRDGRGIVQADLLARKTIGAAHVVTLASDASYALTDRLGKRFSVFHEAVRTYRPALDVDVDDPADHPIALPASIEKWPDGGTHAFMRFIADGVLRGTVVGRDIYRSLPSFSDVHSRVLQQRRKKATKEGASDKQLLDLALEENDGLNRKLKEEKETYDGLLQSAEADRRQLEGERDQARDEARNLQARVIHLELGLQASGKAQETPIPDNFDSLEEWCGTHLAGSVYVLPRAYRAAAKSEFDNPALAYKALLVLRDCFVPMKREGGLQMRLAYEERLKQIGMEEQPCFAGARAGEHRDEYRVTYKGRLRDLDRHLKGSNSRDERFGFRLYFLWDDDSQQVVVGSFPTHLTTRVS